ncbi:MAG: HEAT repeat domain-containing protein [Candidatus Eremiobacteraeota bacterium]|nr:HEAT repeat domain-containing protein [Candidatus Eremiobacteraeota bacterium]
MAEEKNSESHLLEKIGLKIYDFSSRDDCLKALYDDYPENRIKAIDSLTSFSDFSDIPLLADLLRTESNINVKRELIKALGESGRREALEPLSTLLVMDVVPELIHATVKALSQLRDGRAIPYIETSLEKVEDEHERDSIRKLLQHMKETLTTSQEPFMLLKKGESKEDERDYYEIIFGPIEAGDDERPLQYLKEALSGKEAAAVEKLAGLLADEEEKVRLKTVRALSHLPYSDSIKEALLKALRDKNDTIRMEALMTLLITGDERLSVDLFPHVSDENPLIAQEVMKFIQNNPSSKTLQLAQDAIESKNTVLKTRAVSLLARTDNESAMPLLVTMLQDTNQPVEIITELISALKPRRAHYVGRALPHLLKKADKQILKQLAFYFKKVNDPNLYGVLRRNLVSGDPRIRHGAAYLAGQGGDERSVDSLIQLLDDPYDMIKIQAGWSLAHLEAVKAYDNIVATYKESGDIKLRKAFMEILSRLDQERALHLLLEASEDLSPEIRYHAAQLLGVYSGKEVEMVVTALQKCLQDRDMRVIFISADSLIKHGATDFSIPASEILTVLNAYLGDKRQAASFRAQALRNIVTLDREKGLDLLIELLQKEDDEKILSTATEALMNFQDPRALESLTGLLESENPLVKKKAVQTLILKEDPLVIPHFLAFLEKILKKDDPKYTITIFLITEYLNNTIRKKHVGDLEASLIRLLKHKSVIVKQLAAFHLSYGGSERIKEPFSSILKSSLHSLHYLAAFGSARYRDEKASSPLVDILLDREFKDVKESREKSKMRRDLEKYYEILERFEELDDEGIEPGIAKKILAAKCLERLHAPHASAALKKTVQEKDLRVAAASIRALGAIEEHKAVPFLLEVKENRLDFPIQAAVDSVLKRFPDETKKHLAELLKSGKPSKRAFASRIYADIRGLAAPGDAISALKDEYWLVRYWAVTALALQREKDAELIYHLEEALQDPSPLVRSGALYALIGTDPGKFVQYILRALADRHFFVKAEATKIAGGMRLKQAEKALLVNINDESSSVRAASARALGEVGCREAVPILMSMIERTTSQEKVWSSYALMLLTGEKDVAPLSLFLVDLSDDHPDELIAFKMEKPSPIKFYPGVYKKLAELGFKAAPLLYREEFEELKRGNKDIILRFVRNLDRIYAEKISESRENLFQAIEALGALGTKEALAPLAELMKQKREKTIKLAALRALGPIGTPGAQIALVPGLADPSQEVYVKTAQMLRRAKREVIQPHIDRLFLEKKLKPKQIYKILTVMGGVSSSS